ncbi:MAG: hypothetical protein ABI604_00930 [Nitrospirota bacterium]
MSTFRSKGRMVEWCRCMGFTIRGGIGRGRGVMTAAFIAVVILTTGARSVAAQSISAGQAVHGVVSAPLVFGQSNLDLVLAGAAKPATTQGYSWRGVRKGIYWSCEGGRCDPHHYVEFTPNICLRNGNWSVSGPLWPGFWGMPPRCAGTVRAYYSWPGSRDEGYPASAWTLYGN